jgi:hypothetical protein
VLLFGFSTGTKGEKLIFYTSNSTIYLRVAYIPTLFSLEIRKKGRKKGTSKKIAQNILNSLLVPVLNTKNTTFSHLVLVQRPQEMEEKISKKVYFGYLYRFQIPYFWT